MPLFDLGSLTEDDRLILSRVRELARRGTDGFARFTAFLDTRQQALAEAAADREGNAYAFFGGYDGAERRMLGLAGTLPPEEFPLCALTVSGHDPFTHRDLLGALTHLGIDRSALGDLCVDGSSAVIFVTDTVAPVILDELRRVGRAAVRVSEGGLPSSAGDGVPVSGTVHSPRLDAVLSMGLHVSREKAQELVRQGRVQRNHAPEDSPSRTLLEGDLLSVSGFGRVRVDRFGGESKKGRMFVNLIIYGNQKQV